MSARFPPGTFLTRKALGLASIDVTFPDGSVRSFPRGTTFEEMGRAWDPAIAARALAVVAGGRERDLYLAPDARVTVW